MSASPSPSASSHDLEKSGDQLQAVEDVTYEFSDIDEKKLKRKMDWALLPWCESRRDLPRYFISSRVFRSDPSVSLVIPRQIGDWKCSAISPGNGPTY
ncbi:hypothetical protein M422DRAFT_240540 [Sphaerobolus stellatus SS14]|nr:hypothetical protein M422DRAFT_240540 [Sphaerobolus stellatus SS14]